MAPQNTFLGIIIRKFEGQSEYNPSPHTRALPLYPLVLLCRLPARLPVFCVYPASRLQLGGSPNRPRCLIRLVMQRVHSSHFLLFSLPTPLLLLI